MISTLGPDLLLHIATLLHWEDAFCLQRSCRYALLVVNVRAFWREKALQRLLTLQERQLGTTRLHVQWEDVLDISNMSCDEACRVCRRADVDKPAAQGYAECLSRLLDGSESNATCRRHLCLYLRSEPCAYLYSGLVSCGARRCVTTVGLCASETGVVDIILSNHGSAKSAADMVPAAVSARRVVTYDERTTRNGGRTPSGVDAFDSTPRFGRCFLYIKASPVLVNLALFMESMPCSTARRSTDALPAIVALMGERLDVILMYALQAIARDSIDGICEVMRRLKHVERWTVNKKHVGHGHGSLCLSLETLDNGVVALTRPYYTSATHGGRARLHRRLAQMLGLDDQTIHWPDTIVHSTTRRVYQVQIDFFMLYTQDLCPRVHAWWMRNAAPFSHSRVGEMRRCVARYNLPPIQRVPVEGGVFACVIDTSRND